MIWRFRLGYFVGTLDPAWKRFERILPIWLCVLPLGVSIDVFNESYGMDQNNSSNRVSTHSDVHCSAPPNFPIGIFGNTPPDHLNA